MIRQSTGRPPGRLPKVATERLAVRQAHGELDAAPSAYELALSMAEGTTLRTMQLDEARRRVAMAARWIAELKLEASW